MTLVILGDLGLGQRPIYGLLCAVPLVVATTQNARSVVAWGLLALVTELLLGYAGGAHSSAAALVAHAIRVGFCVLTTALGCSLAARRVREHAQLSSLRDVALAAQRSILRDLPASVAGWPIAVSYQAAAAHALIGGDLYDAVPTPEGLLVLIGDVRGKGLAAVRLASLVLGTFRHPDTATSDPAVVFDALHRTVEAHGDVEDFVTAMLIALHHNGSVYVFNAGHPPVLYLPAAETLPLPAAQQDATAPARSAPVGRSAPERPTEATLLVGASGPPLGLAAPAPGTARTLVAPDEGHLGPGDRLLLYTDGLTEARRPDDRKFFSLLEQASALLHTPDVQSTLDALMGRLAAWTSGDSDDDVALLVVQRPLALPAQRESQRQREAHQ